MVNNIKGQTFSYTPIQGNFSSSDTMVNFMRDPGLQAWDLRCYWNNGGNCFKTLGDCNSTSSGSFTLAHSSFIQPYSTVFLKGYSNHFTFNEGFVISIANFTRSFNNGMPPISTVNITNGMWWQNPSRITATSRIGLCSVYDNDLMHDNYVLLNTAPGDSIDSLISQTFFFDFVSGGTFFDLTYVFMSDEYDTNTQANLVEYNINGGNIYSPTTAERICSSCNDGIGMFLHGPGINGPYSNNAENIAMVPGTNQPVCVRTIHPQLDTNASCGLPTNAQYFKWNTDTFLTFSGYTTPLNVKKIQLNPCDTYHLALSINEAGPGLVTPEGGGQVVRISDIRFTTVRIGLLLRWSSKNTAPTPAFGSPPRSSSMMALARTP